MDGFEVILGLEWIDKFVINQFGKKVDKLLLDNEDGKGGVIVSMHRKHRGDTKPKATSMVARLCTTKVASRAVRKDGQLFLCTALITKPKSPTSKIQLGEESFKKIIEQFNGVLTRELPNMLPPQRAINHKIQIVPRSIPPAKAPYHMSVAQLEELKCQLWELEACGFI